MKNDPVKMSDYVEQFTTQSDSNYKLFGYFVASLVTLTGIFFIYEIIVNSNWVFHAQWNMFKSPIGTVCMGVGFLMAIVWWGKFTHWSATPVVETRDGFGRVERKEDYDITNQLFGKFLLPLLGHFVIEPIVYGAIVYYPIQCIIAIVGSVFSYIISLIILGVIILSWCFTSIYHSRNQMLVLLLFGMFFIGAFGCGGYLIMPDSPTVTEESDTLVGEDVYEDAEINEDEFE